MTSNIFRSNFRPALVLLLCFWAIFSTTPVEAQEEVDGDSGQQDVVIELFYRGDSDQSLQAKDFLEQLRQRRPGIEVKAYDVLEDKFQLKRLWLLSKQFGHEKGQAPTIFLCNNLIVGFRGPPDHRRADRRVAEYSGLHSPRLQTLPGGQSIS